MAYPTSRLPSHFPPKDTMLDGSESVDPAILDGNIMHSPHDGGFAKDSFANPNAVLSPATSHAWDPQYSNHLSVEHGSVGAPNVFQDDSSLYPQQGHSHPPNFSHPHHQPSWNFDHGSGECTPTNGGEFMQHPHHFEGPHYIPQRADSVQGSFSQTPTAQHFPPAHSEPGFIPAPQAHTPMSPHSHQEWMVMAHRESEDRRSQKRMRPMSPHDVLTDFRPRDGIRKKNNRIDIPPDRNISTIDDMINKATNEELIKELKGQKRLLRNREAALASRQRKKKHTEDLETKEKDYTSRISMLEAQLSKLTVEREQWTHEMHNMRNRLDQSQRLVEAKENEKRELRASHEQETSNLRLKLHYLTEQLEAPAMSAVPSSTGFTDCNVGMEALSMDTHEWNNLLYIDEMGHDAQHDTPNSFAFDPKPDVAEPSPTVSEQPISAAVGPTPAKKSHDADATQPAFSGLLFVLLLCGAFVASRPPSAQYPDMPPMPATVRAEAPAILRNLLSEPNSASQQHHTRLTLSAGPEATPSSLPYASGKGSRLDRLHRSITSPTRQQEIDQAFSLTPTQYASLTNTDVPVYHQQPVSDQDELGSPPQRSLRQALALVEDEYDRNQRKSEVHTRSRLWEQLSEDVVKQFKDMVRDQAALDAQQAADDHDYDFKIEPRHDFTT